MIEKIFVSSSTIPDKILRNCHSLIAVFFPYTKIVYDSQSLTNPSDVEIKIENEKDKLTIYWREKNLLLYSLELSSREIEKIKALPELGKEPILQIITKQSIVKLLTRLTGEVLPWGILTGVRPGRLIQRMNEQKISQKEQENILGERYLVSEQKIKLLQKIAFVQKKHIEKMISDLKNVSIYISIPFCPSRCSYCTFPYNDTGKKRERLSFYLSVLQEEIKRVGEMMYGFGYKADNIYIGGGTPTILTCEELEELLDSINNYLPFNNGFEFTVEAGRPDTITEAKLKLMKDRNINRLSINPQSMHQATLQKIGRNHTVEEVLRCYESARELSDWILNMDLIIGLPDEGLKEVEETLNKVLSLKIDNITVHVLALKRGSIERQKGLLHKSGKIYQEIQDFVQGKIISSGFIPYYLYRQKYTAGNLENIGYSLPGKECRYNIAIIEEKQNLFGLGAGAVTKIFDSKDFSHVNFYHPIDSNLYCQKYKEIHKKRMQSLAGQDNIKR